LPHLAQMLRLMRNFFEHFFGRAVLPGDRDWPPRAAVGVHLGVAAVVFVVC